MARSLTSFTRETLRPPLRLEALEERTVPSSVVPNSAERRGLAFSDATNTLFFTTTVGEVRRYSPATNAQLPQYNVPAGGVLNGLDLTPDGKFLYAAEDSLSKLAKVTLSDGTVTEIAYSAGAGSNGAFDIAFGSDGKGLVTSRRVGAAAGGVDFLTLDPATDKLTKRSDIPSVYQDTPLFRGAVPTAGGRLALDPVATPQCAASCRCSGKLDASRATCAMIAAPTPLPVDPIPETNPASTSQAFCSGVMIFA